MILMIEFGGSTRVELVDRSPWKVQDPLMQENWGEGRVPAQTTDSGAATGTITGHVCSRSVGAKTVVVGFWHDRAMFGNVVFQNSGQSQASVKLRKHKSSDEFGNATVASACSHHERELYSKCIAEREAEG